MLKRITGTLWVAGLFFSFAGIATKNIGLIIAAILLVALAVFLKWLYTEDREDSKEKKTETQNENKQVEPIRETEPKAHAGNSDTQTSPAAGSAERPMPEDADYTLDAVIKRYSVRCNFTIEQQKEWLTVLSKTIPTIMLGENPLCVDYYLMPRQLEEAGNMLNTVGRIAFQVGKILSITNLEKALNTDSVINLIRTYCILNVYAGMLKEPHGDAIHAGKAYIYGLLKKVDLTKLKPSKEKTAISKEKCMISQFAALYVHTNDNTYRDDYINRLCAIGFEKEEAEKLLQFEYNVIRRHRKTYLRDPEFVRSWVFSLKEPVFQTYPQKKEDLLKEKGFAISELCKLIDEAEWHYWNSHEKAIPEKAWEEICNWRIKGAGGEFAVEYFEMIAEETGIPLEKLAALSRENGKHLVRYKWC